MKFEIEKFRILTIEREKYQIRNTIETLDDEILRIMKPEYTYTHTHTPQIRTKYKHKLHAQTFQRATEKKYKQRLT